MPYKDKDKEYIRQQARRKPPKECPCCKGEYRYIQGRSKAQACVECYTKYRSLYSLLQSSKYRANKKGIAFDLDLEWILEQGNTCKKTGVVLSFTNNGIDYASRGPYTASIDKIDPNKGYTKDNCQLVSWWYNVSKQQFTEEQVYQLCKQLVDTHTMNAVQNVSSQGEIDMEIIYLYGQMALNIVGHVVIIAPLSSNYPEWEN